MYALASLGAPQAWDKVHQMYRLASLGAPSLLRGGRATMYIAKFFIWQA